MEVKKEKNGRFGFGVFTVNFCRFLKNERRNAMKKMFVVILIVGLVGFGTAQATMLDDFEDGQQNWSGSNIASIANVTTESYAGTHSLKMIDTNSGYPWIISYENHGDLSSLKGTYVEFAVKSNALSNGIAGNTALHFYIGTDASNRSCWSVSEADFQSVPADANGWWVLHLELDSSGNATLVGSTINGTAITDNDYANAWQIGTPDWTNIAFKEFVLPQGSGGDIGTYYFDEIAIGQPIPEPATISLLLIGPVGLIRRK